MSQVRCSDVVRMVMCDGRDWVVCERHAPYGDRPPTLLFMNHRMVRRVRRYPSNWFELPDDALAEVSHSA